MQDFKGINIELKGFPADAPPTAHEIQDYIDYVKNRVDKPLIKLRITYTPEDGGVDLKYTLRDEKFERIRRITGCR